MKKINLSRKEVLNYFIISIITLQEMIYLSYNILNMRFSVIILLLVITFTFWIIIDIVTTRVKTKSIIYALLGFMAISMLIIILNYNAFTAYVDLLAISFINGHRFEDVLNYPLLIISCIVMLYINKFLITLIKSYAIVLVKIFIIISVIWIFYQASNFYITFSFAALIIFIFLESITGFISKLKNARSIPLQVTLVSSYIFVLAFVIASMTHLATDPLKFLNTIDLNVGENNVTRAKIESQYKVTNFNANFNYSDAVMLIVNSPYYMKLRGSTFDLYESDKWSVSDQLQNDNINYKELLNSKIEILKANNISFTEYDIKITHNVDSELFYSPADSYLVSEEFQSTSSSSVFFKSLNELKKDVSYQVSSIKINENSNYERLLKTLTADHDNQLYKQLPDDFSKEVKALALSITKDYDSDYEKVLAIESYLSKEHLYTKTPIDKPNYYDYVEFFLLKSKEGFCTHYASSMVMMLRSVDIPARYVVGYVLDSEGLGSVDRGSDEVPTFEGVERKYLIAKKKSHSWVEVYFEGFGWVEFEPTSPYFEKSSAINIVERDTINPDQTLPEPKVSDHYLLALTLVLLVVLSYSLYRLRPQPSNAQHVVKMWSKIRKVVIRKNILFNSNLTDRELLAEATISNQDIFDLLTYFEIACYSNQTISDETLIEVKKLYQDIKKRM